MLNLQQKISAALLIAFLVIAGLFASLHLFLQDRQVETVMETVQELLHTLVERDRQALANEIYEQRRSAIELRIKQMMQVQDMVGIAIYTADGSLLAQIGSTDGLDQADVNQTQHWQDVHGGQHTLHYLQPITLIGEQFGTIHIHYSLQTLVEHQRQASMLLVIQLIALLVVLMVILHRFMRRSIVRPIAALQAGIKRLAAGDLSTPVAVTSSDEIGALSDAFNQMCRDRAQADAALRSSEEHLRITLGSIADAVIAIDLDGRIRRMNPAACTLCACSEDGAIGQPLGAVVNMITLDDQPWELPAIASIAEQQVRREELMLLPGQGTPHLVACTWTPITGDDRHQVGLVLAMRDITEQKRLEEQLRQAEKMQAMGQLAGGVAHDFNNMLQAISGHAELLGLHPDGGELHRRCLEEIQIAVERASGLVGKLLAFSRKKRAINQVVDMHTVIADTIAMLKHSIDRRINIETRLEADLPLVMGDPSQLQNALLNLGVNARDALTDGGTITISSRALSLDAEHLAQLQIDHQPGDFLEIAVDDNGCGIPAEVQERIFEPFYTTKEVGKGTGLGLAAVFGTMHAHHGGIDLQSEVGRGSSFRLYLPLVDRPQDQRNTPLRTILPGSGCILLVDDDEPVRLALAAMLESIGYTCLQAADGLLALEVFTTERERIDAVILDLNMPRMNGPDCFRALRAEAPELTIIIASGFPSDDVIAPLQALGLAGVLRKPFGLHEVSSMLAEQLSNKRS